MKWTMEGFLLVNDRTGRVLLEIADPVKAFRLLDQLREDEPELADDLCLVSFDDRGGVLIGAETTTRMRTLS
jgi:hypothetical protein